jgi:hypothetical protein
MKNDRYLRKVDCSRCICKYRIHLEEKALVRGTKQSKRALNTCSLKWIFVAATNSGNNHQAVCAINQST